MENLPWYLQTVSLFGFIMAFYLLIFFIIIGSVCYQEKSLKPLKLFFPDPPPDHFKELTKLQEQVGYKKGYFSAIAFMGLMGESGEVLDAFSKCLRYKRFGGNEAEGLIKDAIDIAGKLDEFKKRVRSTRASMQASLKAHVRVKEVLPNMDEEIADALYYLNAIALSRGRTLQDYASAAITKANGMKNKPDISHGNLKPDKSNPLPLYKKLPVEIEAIKYTVKNKQEVLKFAEGNAFPETCTSRIIITTIDGNNATIDIGDYLCRGIAGEYYPCKEDIFKKTYERIY